VRDIKELKQEDRDRYIDEVYAFCDLERPSITKRKWENKFLDILQQREYVVNIHEKEKSHHR